MGCGGFLKNCTKDSIVNPNTNENIEHEQLAHLTQCGNEAAGQTDPTQTVNQNLKTNLETNKQKPQDKMSSKALVDAVKNRDVNSVKRLISEGYSVNSGDSEGRSALD